MCEAAEELLDAQARIQGTSGERPSIIVVMDECFSDPGVIADGMIRMSIILPTYFLCGLMDVMVGQLRGLGYSIMPMIVSLTGACLLRIVWILTVFAQEHTLTILYLSYPVSWFVTFAIHFLCYMIVARKRLDKLNNQPLPG